MLYFQCTETTAALKKISTMQKQLTILFIVSLMTLVKSIPMQAQSIDNKQKGWSAGIGPASAIGLIFEDGFTFGMHARLAYSIADRSSWTFRSAYLWSNDHLLLRTADFKPYYHWQVAPGFQYALLKGTDGHGHSHFSLSLAFQLGYSFGFQEVVFKNGHTPPNSLVEESVRGNHHALFISSGLVCNYSFHRSSIFFEVLPQLNAWNKVVDDYTKYDPATQEYKSFSDAYSENSLTLAGLHINLGYSFHW